MANTQTGYLRTKNGAQLMTTVPYSIGAIYLSADETPPHNHSISNFGTTVLMDTDSNYSTYIGTSTNDTKEEQNP